MHRPDPMASTGKASRSVLPGAIAAIVTTPAPRRINPMTFCDLLFESNSSRVSGCAGVVCCENVVVAKMSNRKKMASFLMTVTLG